MTTWYVSTTGDNSNIGHHPGAPFLTIQHAFDQLVSGDTVRIYAGRYAESNIDPGSISDIKVINFGDGLVVIDGNAGSGSSLGNTVLAHNDWVIDGSTGSNTQNIEIIGGSESCVRGEGGTGHSYSLKHVILTGRGTGDISDEDNSTNYGIKYLSSSTIRNVVIRNFSIGAVVDISNPGPIVFYNNLVYRIGATTNARAIIDHENGDNEIYFNTIVGCTGSIGIDTGAGPAPTIKNNLLAENNFSDSGIYFDTSTNVLNNCVYTSITPAPTRGAYNNLGAGTIDSSNLEVDPLFYNSNPWEEQFDNNVNGNFILSPGHFHYPGSSRGGGVSSTLLTSGTPVTNITTDFYGSTRRSATPTIGALEWAGIIYDFDTKPDACFSIDKVLSDFTINHFNNISCETPRSVEQIPFSKAIVGPSNLKDRTTAYKLEKGKEGS